MVRIKYKTIGDILDQIFTCTLFNDYMFNKLANFMNNLQDANNKK